MQSMPFQPEQASSIAESVDELYLFLTLVTVFFSALIFGDYFLFHDPLPPPVAERAPQAD